MARNEQLIRQHRLLQILERYRYGRSLEELRDELVEELGLGTLHVRSVRRDLEALQAAGIDVAVHDSPRGRVWKIGPRFRGSHTITASSTELIALSLGRDLLFPLAGTPFWIGIESFWSKVRGSLPDATWEHYEKYRQVLHVLGMPAKSYEKHQGILKTVNRAILEHRIVEIEYQSLGQTEPMRRLIRPYGIAFYQSSLYIVAEVDRSGEKTADESTRPMRHLKLDRFRKATALDDWFQPRSGFQLQQHLAGKLGIFTGDTPKKFRIRISAYAAPLVLEDPWHPRQETQMHADGSLTLTVDAAHEMEIVPRVLALGAEAELLSPASARQRLATMLAELAQRYQSAAKTP